MRAHEDAGLFVHLLAFIFLLIPFPPRQRNFSVVTAPVAGGNASSFTLGVSQAQVRGPQLLQTNRYQSHTCLDLFRSPALGLLPGRSPCTGPSLSFRCGHLSGPCSAGGQQVGKALGLSAG